MTCRVCFGDQTRWVRDANGKSIEVPCVCVDQEVTHAPAAPAVPVQKADATPSIAVRRPEWDHLKVGDVVWMPMTCLTSNGGGVFDIRQNGHPISDTQILLDKNEYDVIPACPLPVDDRYRPRRYPDEKPHQFAHILRWDPDRCWWANIGSYVRGQLRDGDYWRLPLPPPP